MRVPLTLVLVPLLFEAAAAQNWRQVAGTEPFGFSVAVNPQNKNTIWFGGFGKIFVSYDGGKTVGRVIESMRARGINYITALSIHPRDTTFILLGGARCVQSRDNGDTWSHALPDSNLHFNGEAIAYELDRPDTLYVAAFKNLQAPDRIFFRSFDRGRAWAHIPIAAALVQSGFCTLTSCGEGVLLGGTDARGVLLRSANYGKDWTITYSSPSLFSEIPKITLAKRDRNTVWAATFGINTNEDGAVLKSTNGGVTWNAISLPGAPWAVETDEAGRVYVGMFSKGLPGAYVSFDNGANWQNYLSGLPKLDKAGEAWMIKANGDPFGIFLADGERGFFKLQNFDLVQVEEKEKTEAPRRFALRQNYPNPFSVKERGAFGNSETVIPYALAINSAVEITIHDVRGKAVRLLRRQFEAAGTRTVSWDGRDDNGAAVHSGVYLCTLRAGKETASRKILLVR